MDLNSKSTYLDTRLDTFEHHGEFADYLQTQYSREPFDLLDKYHIDHILIPAKWPFSYLLEHSSGWRVEMREGTGINAYVLFAKDPSAVGEKIQCGAISTVDRH